MSISKIPTLCGCGCNEVVWNGKKYIRGHSSRGLNNPAKREEVRKKISESMKGRPAPSGAFKKGRVLSEEIEQKQKEAFLKAVKSEEYRKKMGLLAEGRKHSEETKQKMRLARAKQVFSEETRQKISEANTGKKASEEQRQKCSERMMGNTYSKGIKHSEETKKKWSETRTGELNSNWKGGIAYLPYCFKFNKVLKEKIRERDNYQCQMPGCLCTQLDSLSLYGKVLTVHHVHYLKSDCEPDLITLCTRCNFKANYNRDYYEVLFMNKLKVRGLITE